MPALTVHNAEVKTAAVEVKTLTISGKQVTLAVFRQLREEPLISDDGTFNGVPWGTVNYHPDKCADESEHLHAVWQQGDQLRRCKVKRPRWWTAEPHYCESGATDDFYQAAWCINGHQPPKWVEYKKLPGDTEKSPIFYVDGLRCSALLPESKGGPYWGYARHNADHTCDGEEAYRSARAELESEVAEEKALRARIDARWQELSDLPQLFIAV